MNTRYRFHGEALPMRRCTTDTKNPVQTTRIRVVEQPSAAVARASELDRLSREAGNRQTTERERLTAQNLLNRTFWQGGRQ